MKRRFSQLDDEPVLRLQLADDAADKPLEASARLLHACSDCAFGLPRDSSTWDLTSFLLDRQPVSRDTVVAWLNVIYKQYKDVAFEEGAPPAAASATRLYQLLAFADAVGSSRGVVKACLAGLEQLAFEVKLGDKEVQLAAGALHAWLDGTRLWSATHGRYTEDDLLSLLERELQPAVTEAQKQAFAQQLVGQVEPLLHLAYRLQLAPLEEALQRFIQNSTSLRGVVLYGHMRGVLTRRVIQAAADCEVGEEALLQRLVGQRGSLFDEEDGLFVPLDAGYQAPVVKFMARVKQPMPGVAPGDEVEVKLDLNDSLLSVGGCTRNVQLLVGPLVNAPSRIQAVLGEEDAPPPAPQ